MSIDVSAHGRFAVGRALTVGRTAVIPAVQAHDPLQAKHVSPRLPAGPMGRYAMIYSTDKVFITFS